MASKAFRIICDAELGKPHSFLIGRNSVRSDDDAGVEETVKSKRQLVMSCIEAVP
jgi:hypothetical protein